MEKSTGPSAFFPSVAVMSEYDTISISGEGVAALGARLGEIASYLEERASPAGGSVQSYGFASATGTRALNLLLSDSDLERTKVTKELRRLRDLARNAGGVYVRTESLIDARNRGLL